MSKRKNSRLFAVGHCYTVYMETGESVRVERGGLKMLPEPPGTCEWCHAEHDPEQPHDRDSLPYQIKFKTLNGRWPTWSDAMAHCSDDMKAHWRYELVAMMKRHGMEIPADLVEGG